ncbi:MAG: hypothetical protein J1F35_06600 [Erysipelotrichales bacterium]|nr:hypothetical protein [Erysipelotrichales bacterium]
MAIDQIIWGDEDDNTYFESFEELKKYLIENLPDYEMEFSEVKEFEDRIEFRLKCKDSVLYITNWRNKEFEDIMYDLNGNEIGSGWSFGSEGLERILYNC